MSYITGFSKTHVFVDTEDGRIRKFLLKRLHYADPEVGDRVEFYRPADGGDWFLDLEEGYVKPQKDVSDQKDQESDLDQTFDYTAFFSRNAIEEAEKKKEAEDALKADQEREDELSRTFVGKMKNLFH